MKPEEFVPMELELGCSEIMFITLSYSVSYSIFQLTGLAPVTSAINTAKYTSFSFLNHLSIATLYYIKDP